MTIAHPIVFFYLVQEEVDLILYGEKGLFAFEIKYSQKISKQDLKGLQAFSQEYPEAVCYLLYMGERTEYFGNITVIPYVECLQGILKILK